MPGRPIERQRAAPTVQVGHCRIEHVHHCHRAIPLSANEVGAALDAGGFGDIRPQHANVFPFVPLEGIQVSDLARRARVRKQTMTAAVEQLEQAGYVERRPDPHDRRARLVFLTPRGEAVRPAAVAAGRRVEERWAELTSAAEIQALRRALADLLAALGSEGHVDGPHDRKLTHTP